MSWRFPSFKTLNVSEPFPITEYQSPESLPFSRRGTGGSGAGKMTEVMRARSHIFKMP